MPPRRGGGGGGGRGRGAAAGYSLFVGVLVSVMMTSVFVNRGLFYFAKRNETKRNEKIKIYRRGRKNAY